MIESLEVAIRKWADEKGLFDNRTSLRQLDKFHEEVDELTEEVFRHYAEEEDNREAIKNELGDVLVTLVIQAHYHGLSLSCCLQTAYDKISKRTGKTIDGQFIKDK